MEIVKQETKDISVNNLLMVCVKPSYHFSVTVIVFVLSNTQPFVKTDSNEKSFQLSKTSIHKWMLSSCAVVTLLTSYCITSSKGFFLRYCAFCKSYIFFYFALNLSDKDFYGYFDHFVQFYFIILYFIS